MGRRLGYATVAVLRAITDGACYGLDIMERTGLPSGTVYPTLRRLEKREYVRAWWEDEAEAMSEGRPRRRYYELTGEGAEALSEAIRRLRELAGPVEAGGPAPRPEEA